jgi:hypothetical protein
MSETIPPPPYSTAPLVSAADANTMLSSGGSGGRDFSDMPSLASYRSWDERSAASSKGGGDCDMSLPSLSSYRLDEVSMASSYHSRGSAATHHLSHYSEESPDGYGWGSFTSGNVSKSSDLDSDDENEDDHNSDAEEGDSSEFECSSSRAIGAEALDLQRSSGVRPSTVDVSSFASSSLPPAAIETKSILRNKGEGLSAAAVISASQLSLITFGSSNEDRTAARSAVGAMKRCPPITRSSDSSLDDSLDGRFKSSAASTPNSINPLSEENNLPLDGDTRFMAEGPIHSIADPESSTAREQGGTSPERGSLGRNESMPLSELQRKPSDQQQKSSSSSIRESADGSSSSLRGGGDSLPRLPRRTSTMPDDEHSKTEDIDEKNFNQQDQASVSDSSSSDGDLSLGIDTGGDDDSTDCSVQTVDDESLSLERTSTEFSIVSGASVPSDTAPSFHDEDQVARDTTTPRQKKVAKNLAILGTVDSSESEDTTKFSAPQKSSSDADICEISKKLNGVFVSLTRRTHSSEYTRAAGNNGEESGTSGTETELEDTDGSQKQQDKRGTLIRRMSSSLRKVGKSASFRAIGKTASKIRHMSRRKDKESPDSLKRSNSDEPRTT